MSIVLVIGNGFDLALGYDSGYSHFINTICGIKHYFWPFREPDNSGFQSQTLHQHFYEYFISNLDVSNNIKWIDIESELYKYASSKRGLNISEELIAHDKMCFQTLVYWLYLYLNRHQELKYKYNPPKGEDKCVIELLKALSKAKKFDSAYTFNYTNLKERLINFGGFDESSIPSITYVHGSLENSSQNSPNIVLGINTDFSIPQEYSFLQKIHNPNADAANLSVDLCSADEIVFYGLSLGQIDFEYFQSFFKSIVESQNSHSKKHITILTKGENSVSSIAKNIYDMGINMRVLKERSHFNIIDTHEAEIEGSGHNRLFEELLDRISR